jgi:GNAT superfamily N-acetyltransferase
MHLNIRIALPGEAESLSKIAWDAKAAWGYTSAQLEIWRVGLTLTRESIASLPTYVACNRDEAIGFYQINTSVQPVELEHLWILPSVIRQGIGRTLLKHAADYLQRAGIENLLIDSDPNAKAFYTACGAMQVGARAAPIDGDPSRVRPQLRLATSNI